MRVLLVQPDFNAGPIDFRLIAMVEPLALEHLAAMIPEHDVKILDLRLDTDLETVITRFAPQILAVTALTTEVYEARDILRRAKKCATDVFTVVGGHHATLVPQDFQRPYIDAICLGEGEFVFPALIETLKSKGDLKQVPNLIWRDSTGSFVHNGRTIPRMTGDVIPSPRRDLVKKHRSDYSFLVHKPDTACVTGRGCSFRCKFCSVWEFYRGRTRQMGAARVIEELQKTTTDHVSFVDENFMLNPKREQEIADRIKGEGIRRSYIMECRADAVVNHPNLVEKWAEIGMKCVMLGIDGVSDQELSRLNKQSSMNTNNEAIRILKANGILVWGGFVVWPDWKKGQFQRLKEYVYENGITHTQFTVLTPLPGTPLYGRMKPHLLTEDYTCFDTLHAVLPTRLPREEFYRQFASLYLKPDLKQIYQYLDGGLLTMEQIRYGHAMYKQLGRWENYLERDPILGRRNCSDPERGS